MSAHDDEVAAALADALARATTLAPITATHPGFDVEAGYRVLAKLHAWRESEGYRPVGRKIGFTNRTIWPRYGVYRPMWSHVWDRTVVQAVHGRATLDLTGLVQPRIEPEVVFGLSAPLPGGDDPERVLRSVAWIAAGFEIVHSVFPSWKFAAADCTAQLGLHGRLAVGAPLPITDGNRSRIAALMPTFELALKREGVTVDTGVGSNVLGSPVAALMHLRDVLASQPQFPPLAAGEIVTTGTISDAQPVVPGQTWTADYGALPVEPIVATMGGTLSATTT